MKFRLIFKGTFPGTFAFLFQEIYCIQTDSIKNSVTSKLNYNLAKIVSVMQHKKHRITITDIARKLNVSTSTVSRALTEHGDVKAETREKIIAFAKEMDYQPDPFAVQLRKRTSKTIGVIIPKIENRFFSKALSGMQEYANKHGFNLLISQSEEAVDQEKKNLENMIKNQVAGLITSISLETNDFSHFKKVLNSETPIVFFDRVSESLISSQVIIDDYEASFKAVMHLLEQGCKNIAHITGPQSLLNNRSRHAGYKNALKHYEIPYKEELVVVLPTYEAINVPEILLNLLKPKNNLDGIFAINDLVAIEIIHHLKKSDFKIPEDIAIVGFNNETISQFIDPPLTTVESPAWELGHRSCEILIQHINEEDYPIQSEVIKSKLVIRESSLKR